MCVLCVYVPVIFSATLFINLILLRLFLFDYNIGSLFISLCVCMCVFVSFVVCFSLLCVSFCCCLFLLGVSSLMLLASCWFFVWCYLFLAVC